jgi:hypothetical protein
MCPRKRRLALQRWATTVMAPSDPNIGLGEFTVTLLVPDPAFGMPFTRSLDDVSMISSRPIRLHRKLGAFWFEPCRAVDAPTDATRHCRLCWNLCSRPGLMAQKSAGSS